MPEETNAELSELLLSFQANYGQRNQHHRYSPSAANLSYSKLKRSNHRVRSQNFLKRTSLHGGNCVAGLLVFFCLWIYSHVQLFFADDYYSF
jgi:hypothetical protein